ncbi:MAG: hypothetical protein KI791_10225 [Cyclobacteriaceae bacterium]|nr:hypothetical protein [Cyclobacteriaceae bacterium SS2]
MNKKLWFVYFYYMEDDVKGKGLSGLSLVMIAKYYFSIDLNQIAFLGIDFNKDIDEKKMFIAWIILFLFFLYRYWQHAYWAHGEIRKKFVEVYMDEILKAHKVHLNKVLDSKYDDSIRTLKLKIGHGKYVNYKIKESIPEFKKKWIGFLFNNRAALTLYSPFLLAFIAISCVLISLFKC